MKRAIAILLSSTRYLFGHTILTFTRVPQVMHWRIVGGAKRLRTQQALFPVFALGK